ncbi:MAG: hypothetical protein QG641_2213 [Candidatus Poribacteria bacterium]|nr:hypothetical protein [Candidatus Poribacteria bacterium]
MMPAFWFTVHVNKIRIPIFLPLVMILFLAIEIIAIIPLIIAAIIKKNPLLFKIGTGFYLSRLFIALIFYGRKFKVKVYDGSNRVRIAGNWKFSDLIMQHYSHSLKREGI